MALVKIYNSGCGGGGGGGAAVVVLGAGALSSVRCGSTNVAASDGSTVLGINNSVSGSYSTCSTISGGVNNSITQSQAATISGGYGNNITCSNYSSIVGGSTNFITESTYSVVSGGSSNSICALADGSGILSG